MRTKIIFLVLALAFVGIASFGRAASAQETYPAGCSSALGYSVTTGDPCNGEDEAIMMVPGCTTALGYSITSGAPCSGGDEAINNLAGCDSIYGFSTITGLPCNGTAVAILPSPGIITTVSGGVVAGASTGSGAVVGLPRTGLGGEAWVNILYLGSSALIVLLGLVFLSRESHA